MAKRNTSQHHRKEQSTKRKLNNVCVVMTKFRRSASMPHTCHLDTLIPGLDLQEYA